MSSIDERIVQMEFDNKAFEKDVAVTINTLGKLKQELKLDEASKGFEELTKAAKKVDLSSITESVDALQQRFSVFGEFVHDKLYSVLDRVFGMFTALPTKAFNIFWSMTDFGNIGAGLDKFATKTESVQKIMNATRMSIEDVNVQIDKLNWFTDETSYNLTDMINNIGSFTNVGIDLETAATSMIGIADAAGFAGIGVQGATHAMEGFSKAMAAGYMSLQNWKWIKTAGMNTKDFQNQLILAAEELGVIEKGQISVANLETTLKKRWMTTEVMNRALSKFGSTTEDIYSLIEDFGGEFTATEVLDALGEIDGMMDDIGYRALRASQEAKTFQEVIDSVKDAVSTKWMQSFELIFGNKVEATQQVWTPMANSLWDVFAAAGDTRNEILQLWKDLGGRDRMIMTVSNLFNGLTGILERLKGLLPIFQLDYEEFIDTMANKANAVTNVFYNLSKAFSNAFSISEEEAASNKRTIQRHWELQRVIEDYIETGKITEENKKKLDKYGASIESIDKHIKNATDSQEEYVSKSEMARDVLNNLEAEEKELAKAQSEAATGTDETTESLREFKTVGDAVTYLIEVIKNGLISALKGAAPLARDVVYLGKEAVSLMVNIVKTVAALVNVIARTTGEVGEFNSVTKITYTVLKPLQIVVRLITAVLKLASQSLVSFRENIDNMDSVHALTEAFETLVSTLFTLGSSVLGTIVRLFSALAGLFTKNAKNTSTASNATNGFLNVVAELTKRLAVIISYVGAFAMFVGEILVSAVLNLVEAWNSREEKGVFFTILHSKTYSVLKKLWGILVLCADAVKNFFKQFKTDVESGSPFAFVDRIKEKLSQWLGLTKAAEGSGQNFVLGIIKGIQNGIKWLWDTVVKLGTLIISTFNNTLRIHSPSEEGEDSGEYFVDGVIEGIRKALHKIGGITEKLGNAIIDSLMIFFKGFDFELLGKILKSLALFNGARGIGSIADAIKNTSKILKGLSSTIADFNKGKGPFADTLESLQDVAASYKKLISARALREVAVSVGILIGSMIALLAAIKFMKITPVELIEAGVAVAACLAGITISLKLLMKALKDAEWQNMAAVAGLLAGLSSAIISISGAILVLSLASKFGVDLEPGIKAIVAVIASLTASIAIIAASLRNKGTISPKNILSITVLIATLGMTVQGISLAIAGLSFIPAEKLDNGLKSMVAIIGSITASMMLLTLVLRDKKGSLNTKNILSMVVLIQAMTMSVQGMALAIAGLSLIKEPEKLAASVGSIVGVIGAMTMSMALLAAILKTKKSSLDPKNLLSLSTAIVSMGVAVGLMATALGSLAIIGSQIDGGLDAALISIIDLVATLTIAMAALAIVFSDNVSGVDAKSILAVSASFIAMAIAINMLVAPITALGLLPLPVVAIGLGAIAVSLLTFIGAAALAKLVVTGLVALTAAMLAFGAMTFMVGSGMKLLTDSLAALIATLILIGASANTVVRGLKVLADGIVIFVDSLIDGLINIADKIEVGIHKLIVILLKVIVDCIPDALEVVLFLGTRIIEVLAKFSEPLTAAILQLVFGILKALVEKIPDMVSLLIDALNIFADTIREYGPEFEAAVVNILSAIWERVTNWAVSLNKWLEDNPLYLLFFPKENRAKVKEDVDAFFEDINNSWFGKDWISFDFFKKGAENGVDYGTGLAEGAEATKDLVKTAGNDLAYSAETGVTEPLMIKSPSRVAMAIGTFFAAGMALGMEAGRTAVEESAGELANSSVEALQKVNDANHGDGTFDSIAEDANRAAEASYQFRSRCLEAAVALNEITQKSIAYKDIAKMELLNERDIGRNLTAALANGADNIDPNAVKAILVPIGTEMGTELADAAEEGTKKFDINGLLKTLEQAAATASKIAYAIKDVAYVVSYVRALIAGTSSALSPIVQVTNLINAITNAVVTFFDVLIKIGENGPTIVASMQYLVLGIIGMIETLIMSIPMLVADIRYAFVACCDQVTLGLYDIADTIERDAPAIANAIGRIIRSIFTSLIFGIDGFVKGLVGIDFERPIDTMYNNFDRAANKLDRNVKKRAIKSGVNGGVGFGMGVASTEEFVDEVSSDLANSSVSEMEKALDEHSPSRRTFRVGVFEGAGLAMGIVSTSSVVADSSHSLGDTSVTNIANGAGISGTSSPVTSGYGTVIAGGLVSTEVQNAWNRVNQDYYDEGRLLPQNIERGAADAANGTSFGALLKNAWSKVTGAITGNKPKIDVTPDISDETIQETIDSLEKDIERGKKEKKERDRDTGGLGFHSREQQELLRNEEEARIQAAKQREEELKQLRSQRFEEKMNYMTEQEQRKQGLQLYRDYCNDRIDVGNTFEKENDKLLKKAELRRERERRLNGEMENGFHTAEQQELLKEDLERERTRQFWENYKTDPNVIAQNNDYFTEYYLGQVGLDKNGDPVEKKVVSKYGNILDRINGLLGEYSIVPPDADIDLDDATSKIEELLKSTDTLGATTTGPGGAATGLENVGDAAEDAGKKAKGASKGVKALGKDMASLDFKDYASNVITAEQSILRAIDYANFGVKQGLSVFKEDAIQVIENYINKIGDLEAVEAEYADVSNENGERQKKIQADLKDAFINRFEEIEEAIKSSLDIWNKLDKKSRGSTKSIKDNLADQKKSYKEWAKGIRELAQRGLNFDVLQELISGGLGTFGDVRTFLQFTPEEMAQFNKDYGDWMADASKEALDRLADEAAAAYTATAKEVWEPLAKTQAEITAEALGKTLDEYKSYVSDIRSMLNGTLDVFNKYEEQAKQSLLSSTKNILSQKDAINKYNELFDYAATKAKLGKKTLEWIKELGVEQGTQILLGIRYATKEEVIEFQKMINGFFASSKSNAKDISELIAGASGNTKATLAAGINDVQVLAEKAAYETAEKVKESTKSTLENMKNGIKSVIHSFQEISEVTKSESVQLTQNLVDQTSQVDEWTNSLIELARRGLGRAVIENLAEQGVSSLGIVRGFMDMSLSELKDYNKKWIDQTGNYKDTVKVLKKSLNQLYSDENKTSDWFYRNADSAAKDYEIKQQKMLGKIRDQYNSVTATIKDLVKNQINVFEKFDKKTDISAKKLLRNMRSQIDGVKTWAENIERLGERGISQPLLDKLQALGPNGYKYTQAFVDMTDEQLQEAVELFAESEALPDSVAQNVAASYMSVGEDVAEAFAEGLNGSFSIESVAEFGNAALVALQKAFGIYENNPTVSVPAYEIGRELALSEEEGNSKTMEEEVIPQLEQNGEGAVDDTKTAIVDEIKNVAIPDITAASKEMTEAIVFSIRDTILQYKPRLKLYGKNIAYYISTGLANGISAHVKPTVEAMTVMMERIVAAAKSAIKSNSPSKVFYQIGEYIDEGLANGISENGALPEGEAEDMGDFVAKVMRDAIAHAMELADDELSTDPIIRPVLDLSNVQNGSGLISDMFANRMIDVSGINFIGKSQISDEMIGQLSDAIMSLKASNEAASSNPIVVNVYGAQGQDANDIANEVMHRLNTQFNNRKAVYA